jgi:hypothetical protein
MAPVNQIVMFTIDPVMHLVRRRAPSQRVLSSKLPVDRRGVWHV